MAKKVTTVEAVGAMVRTEYDGLARITEVIESSRLSDQHVAAPGDVVVALEPVGPSYGITSAWASTLALAEPTDMYGRHPHTRDCECGLPFEEYRHGVFQAFWYELPAS
jgi:hypothetical protein